MGRPPKGSKTSLKSHLKQVEKATGKTPDQLKNQPKPPADLLYIFYWYMEIRLDCRLTYQELKAWSELTCKSVKAWEAELIISIDRTFWRIHHG